MLAHGNGPQVGLLALQAAAYTEVEPYPLDVLGAQTQGMIGYFLEQELGNHLGEDTPFATLLTMIEVDPADPAFDNPTKFVGPVYAQAQADALAEEKGWAFKQDGEYWRRVVPSPEPRRIFEIRAIQGLLDHDVVVICAGGGGVPVMFDPAVCPPAGRGRGGHRQGPRQRAARPRGVRRAARPGDRRRRRLHRLGHPGAEASRPGHAGRSCVRPRFAAGSMGPKVEAAARFVEATGKRAAIGALDHIEEIVEGTAGTQVVPG